MYLCKCGLLTQICEKKVKFVISEQRFGTSVALIKDAFFKYLIFNSSPPYICATARTWGDDNEIEPQRDVATIIRKIK